MITKEQARNLAVKANQSQIDEIYEAIKNAAKNGESYIYVYNVKEIIDTFFKDNGFYTETVSDITRPLILSLKIKW